MADDEIFAAWDRVDLAIARTLTAQPWQMTQAAEQLESAQKAMRAALFAPISRRPAVMHPNDIAEPQP